MYWNSPPEYDAGSVNSSDDILVHCLHSAYIFISTVYRKKHTRAVHTYTHTPNSKSSQVARKHPSLSVSFHYHHHHHLPTMPGINIPIYIPPWVFICICFAGLAAYLFALSVHMDPQDPTDTENNVWTKVNYGVAAGVALLAIITIPIGILHQRKLRNAGWRMGKSPQQQADEITKKAAKYNITQPAAAPQYIQMVPMQAVPVSAPAATATSA